MGSLVVNADLATQTASPAHTLGSRFVKADGSEYKYLQANSAKTAYLMYADAGDGLAGAATTYAAGGSAGVVVAQIAVSSGWYAWFFKGPGAVTITTDNSVAAGAKLYTSATAGKVDDASSSQSLIYGLTCAASVNSSSNGSFYANGPLFIAA